MPVAKSRKKLGKRGPAPLPIGRLRRNRVEVLLTDGELRIAKGLAREYGDLLAVYLRKAGVKAY